MRKHTVTVSVGEVYRSLPGTLRTKDAESTINTEVKRRFERQGIHFLDKPGLYPVPPCKMSRDKQGGSHVITISQWRDDA